MSEERSQSRPWSEAEDALLRQAVARYGESDRWKDVALMIPGRTNKACRKRWLHSLQPNVKKSAWTAEEDKLLLDLYDKLGPKWSTIARSISGRTDDACSKRYREALDPNLKKDDWTPDEEKKLMEVYNRIGGKWGQVGQELQRSGLGCRNRWRLLERKKLQRAQGTPISPTLSINEPQGSAPGSHQLDLLQGVTHGLHWAPTYLHPHYPPEAYPIPLEEPGVCMDFSLQDTTPEPLVIPDPQIAPFQFSSSSLSAALSDPPRPARPLPSVSVANTPEVGDFIHLQPEQQPSLSPLHQCNGVLELNDDMMLLDPSPYDNRRAGAIVRLPFESDHFNNLGSSTLDYPFYPSPLTISSELTKAVEASPMSYLWKARGVPETDFDNSPCSIADGPPLFNDGHDDQSSASSTPFPLSTPLSPTASPHPLSYVDLPISQQPSSSSLLFSLPTEPRSTSVRGTKKSISRKNRPTMKLDASMRLSSVLPLSSDPNIRPYACGHEACWPEGETTSLHCFTTSGDLSDHWKDEHLENKAAGKLFKCALPGCGRAWKSINGLQYHLQLSTAHFTTALSSRFFKQKPNSSTLHTPASGTEAELEDSEPERKYTCPRPGCFKAYRQPSGLRYHIKHGHPPDMPTQLEVVPPALERQMPIKAKKMRAKLPGQEETVAPN